MPEQLLIKLGETTTSTDCGDCPWLAGWCRLYDQHLDGSDQPRRSSMCMAAGKAAARLVELDPQDVAKTGGIDDLYDLTDGSHAYKVQEALRAHAAW